MYNPRSNILHNLCMNDSPVAIIGTTPDIYAHLNFNTNLNLT